MARNNNEENKNNDLQNDLYNVYDAEYYEEKNKFEISSYLLTKIEKNFKNLWVIVEELRRITRIGERNQLNEEYENIVRKIYETNDIDINVIYQNNEPHPFIKLVRDIGNSVYENNLFNVLYVCMTLLFDTEDIHENDMYYHIYTQWEEKAVHSQFYRMLWNKMREYDILETFIQDFLVIRNNQQFINNLF